MLDEPRPNRVCSARTFHGVITGQACGIDGFHAGITHPLNVGDAQQQVFDERRGGGEQHRWRERLADLALQVHRRLELVRTVDREDGRHAGDHGGQIFDGRFRAIAVEIA